MFDEFSPDDLERFEAMRFDALRDEYPYLECCDLILGSRLMIATSTPEQLELIAGDRAFLAEFAYLKTGCKAIDVYHDRKITLTIDCVGVSLEPVVQDSPSMTVSATLDKPTAPKSAPKTSSAPSLVSLDELASQIAASTNRSIDEVKSELMANAQLFVSSDAAIQAIDNQIASLQKMRSQYAPKPAAKRTPARKSAARKK